MSDTAAIATKTIFDSATGTLIMPGEPIPAHLDAAKPKNGVIPGTGAPKAKAAIARAGDATAKSASPVTAGSSAAANAAANAAAAAAAPVAQGSGNVQVEKGGPSRRAKTAAAKPVEAKAADAPVEAKAADAEAPAAGTQGEEGGSVFD